MNDDDRAGFDPRIADWLEDDPNTAPDEALRIVLSAIPSIRQPRGLAVRWRSPLMQIPKLALGAIAVVAIAAASFYFLAPLSSPRVGGEATGSPSVPQPSASAPGDGAPSAAPTGSGDGGEPTILAVTATGIDCTSEPGVLSVGTVAPGSTGWITVTNDSTGTVFFQLDKADNAAEYEQFRLYMQAEHQRATEGKPLVGPATMVELGASRLVAAGATDRFLAPTLAGMYGIACLPEEDNVVVDAYLVGPLTVGP